MKQVGSIENGVLIGREGQLFLVGGAHSVLDFASGKALVPDASYAVFEANVAQRAIWAAARRASYLHVIFPDKQSVLLDDYPLPRPVRLGEMYLRRAASVAERVLYPRDMLRQHQGACFLKTDTHLSDRGIILATIAVVERITGTDCGVHATNLLANLTSKRNLCGDLGSKLMPQVFAEESFLVCPSQAHEFSNRLSGNNGLADIWISPGALLDKRLLIFGDSFARNMAKVLSFFFKDILFTRTPFFHVDIVDQMQPDYIISENVERYLANVKPDRDRPCFHMYPYLGPAGASYSPGRDFAEAFSAMLSYPRGPYRDFIAKFQRGNL